MLKGWVHVSSSHRHLKSADYATLNVYRYISSWEKLGLCLSFLSLDSCTLVALVNLSMSILRDKNSPHGCPHTGGGHCAGTLITRQALSVGACIHINTAIVFPCGGRRMHLLFYSPQMCWDRVAFMILIGGSNGVLKSLVSSSFFFHNSTILSQRVLSKRWKEGRWGLHMFWGPCMGISMCM